VAGVSCDAPGRSRKSREVGAGESWAFATALLHSRCRGALDRRRDLVEYCGMTIMFKRSGD
jgi:hypothetical protein